MRERFWFWTAKLLFVPHFAMHRLYNWAHDKHMRAWIAEHMMTKEQLESKLEQHYGVKQRHTVE